MGLTVELEFGTHSLEALLWVAETIEAGVYEHASLQRDREGLEFALSNPPLRMGAFDSVRLFLDGTEVPRERVSVLEVPGEPWRPATGIDPARPLELLPGRSVRFRAVEGELGTPARRTVRLELRNVAVPPLVWLEFSDEVRGANATT